MYAWMSRLSSLCRASPLHGVLKPLTGLDLLNVGVDQLHSGKFEAQAIDDPVQQGFDALVEPQVSPVARLTFAAASERRLGILSRAIAP